MNTTLAARAFAVPPIVRILDLVGYCSGAGAGDSGTDGAGSFVGLASSVGAGSGGVDGSATGGIYDGDGGGFVLVDSLAAALGSPTAGRSPGVSLF